jgi:Rha family phage regulatory protein
MASELLENPVIQVSGTATIEPNVEVANLCEVRESQVVTTSLRVAEIFSKQHKHVLEAIRNLDCSDGFRGSNFRLTLKDKELHGSVARQDPFYFITRDGFIFLVMGFTGKTAAKYKEAYIYAFNEMEAKLRRQQEEERMLRRMQQSSTPTFADAPRVVHDLLQQTDGIVESYGKQRVVSSVTLARLTGKEHRYICDSVRRMFKHVLRPNRLFIRVTRTVRKGYGQGYDSDTGIMYFITIEGFQTMRTHCTGLPDDVAAEVITAFHHAKGKNRPGQPNAVTPKPTHGRPKEDGQPKRQAAPTLPETTADMMQRFVKAMGVMMGMDVSEITDLMNGGNK